MPKMDGIASPEGSDDDSVSITSTSPSEPRDEYPLEGVLAERTNGGIKEYLVKWQGYPEERCTWETESNFQDDNTLFQWQARNMRITRGLDKPYDVDALEARVEAWVAATKKRKARRRTKRRRLGLPVASDETSEESSSEEAEEVALQSPRLEQASHQEGSPDLPGFVVDDESEDEDDPQYSDSKIQSHRKQKSRQPVDDRSDEALTDDSLMEDLHTKAFNDKHKRIQKRTKPRGDRAARKDSFEMEPQKERENRDPPVKKRFSLPQADLSSKVTTTPVLYTGTANKTASKPESSQMGTAGHGPARLNRKSSGSTARPKVSGAAVLGNWAAKAKPRKLSEPKPRKPSLIGSKPETFNKLSTKRRYEKAGRNEPAPNPEHLTFVNLKAAKGAKSSIPLPPLQEPVKTPFQLIQERLAKEEEQRLADEISLTTVTAGTDAPTPTDPAESSSSTQTETDMPQPSDDQPKSAMPPGPLLAAVTSPERPPGAPRGPHIPSSPIIPPTSDVQHTPARRSVSFETHGQRSGSLPDIVLSDAMTVDATPPSAPANSFDLSSKYQDFSDVFATIKIGLTCADIGDVRFRGLDKPSKRLLLGIKIGPRQMHVWFKQICTAEDYRAFYHVGDFQYLGAGHIVSFPQTAAAVETMAENLRIRAAGGLFFTNQFMMIIYPVGVDTWSFLDDIPGGTSPQACLRFVMRPPVRHMLEDNLEMAALDLRHPVPDGESGVNAMFRNMFRIEYSRLIPQAAKQKDGKPNTFFLLFPPSHEDQHDLIVKFLEANEATIYSSNTPGAWDYFCNFVNAGVVLIHDTFHTLHLIPGLARLLRKPINIFAIDLNPAPLESYLLRLFPHGAALLLTDSVILLHPQRALAILKWFQGFVLTTKPLDTWKLAMRPRFRDWILSIIESRSVEEGKLFVEIYAVIYRLLPMDLMDEDNDLQSPVEDAPMVCPKELSRYDPEVGIGERAKDLEGMESNDARLVEWFAGWARTKLEYYRKLHVICTADREKEIRKEWVQNWCYLEIMTPEECFKAHKIGEEKKRE